jgi:hypothetical protein
MDAFQVTQIYFNEAVHLHDIPRTITLDMDVKFMSNFWKSL